MFYKETNFKETQIGKIPKDWDMAEVGDLGEVITGTTPSTFVKEYWNGEYPFVTPTDITEGKYVKETERKVTEKGLQKGRLTPKDSVLVTCIASVGKIALASEPCITNQQINAIICKEGVDPYYVYYATAFRSNILKTWAGRTTNPIVKKSLFEKFPLALPRNVNEQRKIAEVLSTVDEAIQKTNEVIAKTECLKKGFMQELLTKGIGHKEFKDSEIGRIPKEWEALKLSEVIGTIQSGIWGDEANNENAYPVIRSTEITHDSRLDLSNVARRTIPHGKYQQYALKDGDILIVSSSGSRHLIGRCAIFNHAGDKQLYFFSNFMLRIHPTSRIISRFLYYFLSSNAYYEFLKRLQQTSTGLRNLPRKGFLTLKIPLPPLPEQQKIAEVLSTVDKKLELERNEKAKLERIKQGLMDLFVTGKVRVKVN